MKCNELMVGDWITDKHGFPMQVVSVGNDYLYASFEGNEGDVVEFDDKDNLPYPVALTGEFFKRNKFDKKLVYLAEGNIIRNSNKCRGYNLVISLFGHSNDPSVYIHYVHELQQLLRFSGYTELANNVKLPNNDKQRLITTNND